MAAETVTLGGRRYAIVPIADYEKLLKGVRPMEDPDLPPMPKPLSNGNYPAIAAARVMLARDLIGQRKSVRLSQAEVARRAGIRPETLNRIEKAKVSADVATVDRIVGVLDRARKSTAGE